jgi:hypothetical protein
MGTLPSAINQPNSTTNYFAGPSLPMMMLPGSQFARSTIACEPPLGTTRLVSVNIAGEAVKGAELTG